VSINFHSPLDLNNLYVSGKSIFSICLSAVLVARFLFVLCTAFFTLPVLYTCMFVHFSWSNFFIAGKVQFVINAFNYILERENVRNCLYSVVLAVVSSPYFIGKYIPV